MVGWSMFDKLKERFSKNASTGRSAARGQVSATMAVRLVVALTIGGLVAAFLLPVALEEIVNVDTSNYSSGAASLWNIMDIIITLAVFLFFTGVALAAMNKV